MSGILSDIKIVLSVIRTLKNYYDLAVSNSKSCTLLIKNCSELETTLNQIVNDANVCSLCNNSIVALKTIINEAFDVVKTFTEPGWLRKAMNTVKSKEIYRKMEDLNSLIIQHRNEIHFSIDVISRYRQEEIASKQQETVESLSKFMASQLAEIQRAIVVSQEQIKAQAQAKSEDYDILLTKIFEMLEVNHHIKVRKAPTAVNTDDMVDAIVEKLRLKIPQLDSIFSRTETFLDALHDDSTATTPSASAKTTAASSKDTNTPSANAVESEAEKRSRERRELIAMTLEAAKLLKKDLQLIDQAAVWEAREDDFVGEGQFGIVYKGRYHGNDVAIKTFKGLNARSELILSQRRKVEREVFILASCKHPNIIQFMGYDLKAWIMVTELAVTTLYRGLYGLEESIELLISTEQKVRWLYEIAAGLFYLHFHDIIHRDMKTQNVLLCHNAAKNSYIAKISDFGESAVNGLSAMSSRRSDASTVGTVLYQAPEIFDATIQPAKLRYTNSVDIYAFGIIANEMMVGDIPWSGHSKTDIETDVKHGIRPVLFQPDPSSQMEMTLFRLIGSKDEGCLAQDRTIRPTAKAMYSLLQPFAVSSSDSPQTTVIIIEDTKNASQKNSEAFVIDFGFKYCRVGLNNSHNPTIYKTCFYDFNVAANQNKQSEVLARFGYKTTDIIYDELEESHLEQLKDLLAYKMRYFDLNSFSFDDFERFLLFLFRREFKQDICPCPIIFSSKLVDGKVAYRQRILSLFFERFQIPSICLVPSSAAAYIATRNEFPSLGKSVLIIDGGHSGIHVTAIVQGMQYLSCSLELSGRDLTQYLGKLMAENVLYHRINFSVDELEDMKVCSCFMAREGLDLSKCYEVIKDGNIIAVNYERYRAMEPIFEVSLLDGRELYAPSVHKRIIGLADLVYHVIRACPIDYRRPLYESIVVCGGLAKVPGMIERLTKEINSYVPSTVEVRVNSSKSASLNGSVAWFGCSIALTNESDWVSPYFISNQAYYEKGPQVITCPYNSLFV